MTKYIYGYADEYYVFKVCRSEERHTAYMKNGLNHLYRLSSGELRLYTYNGYISMPESAASLFEELGEESVFSINEQGIVQELYDETASDNAFVLTMQCNSNCEMCPCSENARRYGETYSFNELYDLARYFPKDAKTLTITGGEPTLLKDDFFAFLSLLRDTFNQTHFQLLTNARAFCDPQFTQRFLDSKPENMEVGIPLHGFNSQTHDAITRSPGSFQQTVLGIKRLLWNRVDVEIRIVLTKSSIKHILQTVQLIARQFPGVRCVNLMGMELLGNAAKNMNNVWMPYNEIISAADASIRFLIAHGIDVQLYNFPLCAVKEEYWGLCAKSISEYKVSYSAECNVCEVKTICGGVFDSTRRMSHFVGKPVVSNGT